MGARAGRARARGRLRGVRARLGNRGEGRGKKKGEKGKEEKKRKGKKEEERKREEKKEKRSATGFVAGGRAWATGSRAAWDGTAARKKRERERGSVGGKSEKKR